MNFMWSTRQQQKMETKFKLYEKAVKIALNIKEDI